MFPILSLRIGSFSLLFDFLIKFAFEFTLDSRCLVVKFQEGIHEKIPMMHFLKIEVKINQFLCKDILKNLKAYLIFLAYFGTQKVG